MVTQLNFVWAVTARLVYKRGEDENFSDVWEGLSPDAADAKAEEIVREHMRKRNARGINITAISQGPSCRSIISLHEWK